ncbi:MAG: hypothetical protein K9M08_18660 [Pirellula sp.]|nr:hypothetical protein [Pirellula sp.]
MATRQVPTWNDKEEPGNVMSAKTRFFWLCLLLVQLVGCRGCTQQKKEELAKDGTKKEKLNRLTADDVRALPFSEDSTGAAVETNFVKPGHWYQGNSKLKANYDDESLNANLTVVNVVGKRVPFTAGQPHIEFNRSLSLAKGQEKNIRLRFFQPEVAVTGNDPTENPNIAAQLVLALSQRSIGTSILEKSFPNKILYGYQYNIVSISRDPSRYTFWRKQDCIIWPSLARMSDERIAPHRIIDLNEDEVAAQFPDRLYAMTSISHLVINDASISIMSPEQKEAVQDWLRFGGTIVLNGPEAIGGIESSFLKELAPLNNTSNSTISDEEIAPLRTTWSIKQVGGERILFSPAKPIPKLAGQLSDGASWVEFEGEGNQMESLEGLVAERLVGQGRIVMTTFPMTDSAFLSWPSYSSFIHNVILRKPSRAVTKDVEPDTLYDGEFAGTELNPVHSTRLRLWARDLDSTMTKSSKLAIPKEVEKPPRGPGSPPFSFPDLADASKEVRKLPSGLGLATPIKAIKRSSLGAWNSESLVLRNARTSLQESSGITVPRINTIIKLLIGYLVVLVPLNWIVFRLVGRVELAWLAAPIIAIVGAFVVARSVQLDVGFSRSQTVQGFLELHQGYSRGMLSQYTALYSSLSTNYRAVYDRDEGVVLPLASVSLPTNRRRSLADLSKIDYSYADNEGAGLQSIPVASNTTGLLQSEEMLELGGSLTAQFASDMSSIEVSSGLKFPIQDVGVIGLNENGQMQSAWLGNIELGSTAKGVLESRPDGVGWRKEWDLRPSLAAPTFLRADETMWTEQELGEDLYLGPMLEQITKSYPIGQGEYIAVGWTDKPLGGLKISPEAKQNRERTVVLLHLRGAALGPASPDLQIFQKVTEER